MSESGVVVESDAPALGGSSAGQMLRAARERQGMPIEALATAIKVSVRKLELLEADRFDELPDATFTRALAQTVCRTLKLDAVSVLAKLPAAAGHRIEQVSEGLNAPFRDRSPRLDAVAWGPLIKAAWAPLTLLALAAMIWLVPKGAVQSGYAAVSERLATLRVSEAAQKPPTTPSEGVAAEVPEGAASASERAGTQPAVETVFSAPPAASGVAPDGPPATATGLAAAAGGALELRATAESWVEVKDVGDRVLLSRTLQPGEAVSLDGTAPMKVKIGNAAVTEVRFRGKPVDLLPVTSENIARLELK